MTQSAVSLHPQFLVDEEGRRHAVQLDIDEFDSLMELLEDYLDGQALDRAVEAATEFTDFEDVKARLKIKGKV